MRERELFNVTSSLRPLGAELRFLFLGLLFAAGQENAFALLVLHLMARR